jgi:RNA polymerase sigma-70 factor (ECF subfamily)
VDATVDFDTLWSQYEKELTSFVRARLYDKSLAADIMQEVAIKIYKNQSRLASIENSRAWLYRLTRNTLIDFYKKNDKTIPAELHSIELTDNDRKEDVDELSACLTSMMSASLSKSDNEILNLSVIEQYSIKEISRKLNLTMDGTKSKLKRAKKKLSSEFFDCCSLVKDREGHIVDVEPSTDGECSC